MPSVSVTAQPDPPAGWDEFARAHGSFYHRAEWVVGLARCFHLDAHFVTAARDGRLAGILPLLQVPALLGPRRLVSLPFSYMAGPAALSADVAHAMSLSAVELARASDVPRVEIKHGVDASPAAPGFTRVTHYRTYRVPTDGGADAVWRRLHPGQVQRGIKKGQKSGVRVVPGSSPEEWLGMARLQERTARRLGVPAPPRRFFVVLCRHLQQHGLTELLLAGHPSAGLVAGLVLWKGEREWIYAFGASLQERWNLRPNHMLLWRALEEAARAGVTLDLGRAAPEQRGLTDFKLRWGGEPAELAYDYWPVAAGLNVLPRDRGALAVAARVWSLLPLAVTRRASFLYRYLG